MPPLVILVILALLAISWMVLRPNHKEMREKYDKLLTEIKKLSTEPTSPEEGSQSDGRAISAMLAHAQEAAEKKDWPQAISFAADTIALLNNNEKKQ